MQERRGSRQVRAAGVGKTFWPGYHLSRHLGLSPSSAWIKQGWGKGWSPVAAPNGWQGRSGTCLQAGAAEELGGREEGPFMCQEPWGAFTSVNSLKCPRALQKPRPTVWPTQYTNTPYAHL